MQRLRIRIIVNPLEVSDVTSLGWSETPALVRPLTTEEQATLDETYRLGWSSAGCIPPGSSQGSDADLVRRCHAVLLVADGLRVPKAATLLRVDQSTVHRWLVRFETGGLEALVTVHRVGWSLAPAQGGRSAGAKLQPRWDEEYEHLLVDTVRHDPRLERSSSHAGMALSNPPGPVRSWRDILPSRPRFR